MNTPITFRDVAPSSALQNHVTALADQLQQEVRTITSCRVIIGKTTNRHRQGDVFAVHVAVHVPSATLNAEREGQDLYAMCSAAFDDLHKRFRERS